jgi:hypothetical protein
MAGLVILAIMIGYLIISLIVVMVTVKTAKKHGRRGWVWGLVAVFVMYNLVFWDFIPSVVMYKYYCATEAGFWVYKTPKQWETENPGVAETLSMSHLPEQYRVNPKNGNVGNSIYMLPDGTQLTAHYSRDRKLRFVSFTKNGSRGYWLNERFLYENKVSEVSHVIRKTEQTIRDSSSNMPLIRVIYFWFDAPYFTRRDFLFGWFKGNSSQRGACEEPEDKFRKMENIYRSLGEKQ